MSSNGAIPPPIPEVASDLKFDGGVNVSWAPVQRRIVKSLEVQGLGGYYNGSIPKPNPPSTATTTSTSSQSSTSSTSTRRQSAPAGGPDSSAGTGSTPDATAQAAPDPPKSTPVFSTTPTLDEWTFRDRCAKGIIESHIDDLPSLIPNEDDLSAKELFEALVNAFAQKDGMRKVLTMRNLHSMVFKESEPINVFIKRFREARKTAIEAGNDIPDDVFRDITIAAFPSKGLDVTIQNITANTTIYNTSTSVLNQISLQYSRIEDRSDAVVSGEHVSQAHAAMASRVEFLEKKLASALLSRENAGKKCSNCGRIGHVAEECFRKGGGKEGQYPPWWKGKKDPALNSTKFAVGGVGCRPGLPSTRSRVSHL